MLDIRDQEQQVQEGPEDDDRVGNECNYDENEDWMVENIKEGMKGIEENERKKGRECRRKGCRRERLMISVKDLGYQWKDQNVVHHPGPSIKSREEVHSRVVVHHPDG